MSILLIWGLFRLRLESLDNIELLWNPNILIFFGRTDNASVFLEGIGLLWEQTSHEKLESI